jgi:hypothetical protein
MDRLLLVGVEPAQHIFLEVNHIPNITRFLEIRSACLDLVAKWVKAA